MQGKHLAFKVCENYVSIASVNKEDKIETFSLVFEGKKEFQYKEQLTKFIEKHVESEYDEYSLSWFNPKSVLVPSPIFGASNAKDIFNASFESLDPRSTIDFNRISELSIVNTYELASWAKSFFVMKFPRIVIQHEGSNLLRGIFKTSSFSLSIHISVHGTHCLMAIVKHNEVLFYSSFEINSNEDILYFLVLAVQQNKLLQETGTIYIHKSSSLIPHGESLQDLAKNINDLKSFTWVESNQLTFKYQLTCV